MKNVLKPLAVAVVAGGLLSGCMGKFALTDKVYDWNKKVSSERWINEGVFLVFNFLPVYFATVVVDAIVLNSVEWWTGANPVAAAGEQKRVIGADGSEALMTMRADGGIDVQAKGATGEVASFTMYQDGEKIAVVDAEGLPMSVAAF